MSSKRISSGSATRTTGEELARRGDDEHGLVGGGGATTLSASTSRRGGCSRRSATGALRGVITTRCSGTNATAPQTCQLTSLATTLATRSLSQHSPASLAPVLAFRSLNQEARAFTRYISPTTAEHELRIWTVELIRRTIQSLWSDADVECFGSVGTGLYLPGGQVHWPRRSPTRMLTCAS